MFSALVVFLTLSLTLACQPKDLEWNCSELPHLTVQFSKVTVSCGEFYAKTHFEDLPNVKFSGVDQNKKYTLIMVDPDAPGSLAGQGWLHLIRSSISGLDLAESGNFNGYDVTPYNKPTPPKGTGNHRYFIYLYEEFDQSPTVEISKRSKFDIKLFASDHTLCGPVAMNMFVTNY